MNSALPPTSKPVRYSTSIVVLAGLVAAAGLAFILMSGQRPADADYAQLLADYARRFGPRDKLDAERYQDKNGDLIADVPANAAEQLDPPVLKFSGIAFDDPEKAAQTWQPLLDHLGGALGRTVAFADSITSVESQLEALRGGKLHIMAFSTGSVPTAVNTAGFVPVCVPADADGKYAYQMEIIVPAKSGLQTAADLKGQQVTFSSMSSNAGLKSPVYLLREQFGLSVGRDYSFNFSGDYLESIKGIAAGKYQAAPVANDVLRREVARGTIKKDQYRSIFTSNDFPPMAFGHGHNLKPELANKIRTAFLAFDWSGTAVEKEYGSAGLKKFVEVDYKRDWAFVRTVDEGMLRLPEQPH